MESVESPMTSVTCNVCTKNISAESDRIYCFGGCEQIMHSRCADLSPAAAAVLRENKSVKYMCFQCRKKQTALNDIQKQYAELVSKVDSLRELVNRQQSILTSADLDKIESTLLPRILTAINRGNTGRVNVLNASYADVMRSSTNTASKKRKNSARSAASDSLQTASTNIEHGGLLRSGKRRRIVLPLKNDNAPNTPSSTLSPAFVLPLDKLKKSNAVEKMEQTVLFKPKQDQSSEKTKSEICGKLDPVSFAVRDVRIREYGEVAVRCDSKDLALKLVNAASVVFSGKYNIELQKPLKPRIKIIGFTDEMSEEELLSKLRKQNSSLENFDLRVIRVMKNDKRKSNQMSAILETDARGFETMTKLQRVYLGWERCRLVDATDALRCFNCSEFQHKAAVCTKPVCCPKCAGDHKASECEADYEKCINCHLENAKRTCDYDELLDVAHPAWSYDCPVYRKRLSKARQRVDFSY